jgi:hypothetical protein
MQGVCPGESCADWRRTDLLGCTPLCTVATSTRDAKNACWCPAGHCAHSAADGMLFVSTTGVCVEPGCLHLVNWFLLGVTENPGRCIMLCVLNADLDVAASFDPARCAVRRWMQEPVVRCAERHFLDGVEPPTLLQPHQLHQPHYTRRVSLASRQGRV